MANIESGSSSPKTPTVTPFYRLAMPLTRDHGIELSYPTTDRAVIAVAALAIPLADAQLGELIARDYIQADETRLPVMDPRVKGKTATGYLWAYSYPRGQVVYRYHPGCGGKYARGDLAGFAGWLQSDGYQVYQSVAALFGESVRHCACLSHVRRKFVEIIRANQKATGFVARIGELYDIERQLKESQASETTRQQVRAERSLPLLDRLMSELNTAALEESLLPGGALAKACRYALNLRAQLRRSLENGVTEIDNNRCEQSIRPINLGRKNWLDIGAPQRRPGGRRHHQRRGELQAHGPKRAQLPERCPPATRCSPPRSSRRPRRHSDTSAMARRPHPGPRRPPGRRKSGLMGF